MAMFIWMMFVLKIPVVMLLVLVWWSVRSTDEAEEERVDDSGGHGPKRPRPHRPRPPRRGPHAVPPPRPPSRVRVHAGRVRPAHRARV